MQPPQIDATPPGITTVQFAQQAQQWPKLVGETRPPDRFPRRALLWLLPGMLGAALLAALFGYLELRASKQIVYVTGQNRLGAVRADGAQARELRFAGLEAAHFGPPHWSPDGRTVAAVTDVITYNLALLQPAASTALPIGVDKSQRLLLSGQPWSPDSAYLALTDYDLPQVTLRIANVAQASTITVALQLDAQQPLEWHPTRNELLVTAYTPEHTPTLQLVAPDGQVRPFEPQDEGQGRFGGVWSLDGGRVAYLAGDGGYGALWVANGDGGGARQLVPDALQGEPVWSPAGDLIFYTRLLTKTQGYDLYRVKADGSQPPVRIGPGLGPNTRSAVDWRSHIAWSPDGSVMLFEGSEQPGDVTVYVASADGSKPFAVVIQPLNPSSPPVARWSSTNRGILVASGEGMRLYWVDSERNPSIFPSGRFPSWQP